MESANENAVTKKRRASKTTAHLPSTAPSYSVDVHVTDHCCRCGSKEKAKKREISKSAWQALVVWEEVGLNNVDHPICQPCYNEIRDVLIERSDEILEAAQSFKGQLIAS